MSVIELKTARPNTEFAQQETPQAYPDSELVTHITHWTETLFSFKLTRSDKFRFRSGEFAMIGLLDDNGKPILRAYSVASPSWAEELEFYSIKVPDGPLTSRLQNIVAGDRVIVKPKTVGTLVLDALLPGKTLWLIATGTGIAPFASIIRDPDAYERFDNIVLTHTCRESAQLAYGKQLVDATLTDPLIGDEAVEKLAYYPTTTQEQSPVVGRITKLIESEQLFNDLDTSKFHPDKDRVMICGSLQLNTDMTKLLEAAGFTEGSNSSPGQFVVEKAFTEK